MIASVENVEKVTELSDKEVIPVYGGIEVIDTSGHMPGHISLYLKEEKILITGDALDISEEEKKLGISMPQFMMNIEDALKSVKKFLHYDIEKVICYHGGVYTNNVKEGIKSFLEIK